MPYQHFLALLEDETDSRIVADFHEKYILGKEFLIPGEIIRRELAGESPIKLWREHRSLTQQELAKRQGTVETISAVARELDVPLDVLTE